MACIGVGRVWQERQPDDKMYGSKTEPGLSKWRMGWGWGAQDQVAVKQLLKWETREVWREDVELHLVHIDNDISVALKLNMPRPRGRVVWKQDDTL